ncbi:MAG: ISKra4 family transposase [Acidobacteria bacterium]|nr:ISKra4 family transposase [Acidobacteriota bacterium]
MERRGKKTAAAIHQEVARGIDAWLPVIFAERRNTGRLDLEAVELALRTALHTGGAAGLGALLRQQGPIPSSVPCRCGGQARYKDMRSKPLLTVLGRSEVLRAYYWCSRCCQGQFPTDTTGDIEGTEFSPGVRRMLALVGSECSSFERGRQQMELLADLEVTTKAVERVTEAIGDDIARCEQQTIQQAMQLELPVAVGQSTPVMYVQVDGTGVPMVPKEIEGRSGKGEDGRAHSREVKLGCVFTQTATDDQGRPVRDEDSTTYAGAIETAAQFSCRIYTEAHQRGWSRAQKKVMMGDGADWIWNLCQEQFPGAVQIVDLYHARQHLWDLGGKLHPHDETAKQRWVMTHQHLLENGEIEKLVTKLRTLSPANAELAAALRTEANYFERNAERMRYPEFRSQGLFVGSGVIEAGCKTLIGSRLKRSGMFWTLRGANAVIALRCSRYSRRFDDYWESRRR